MCSSETAWKYGQYYELWSGLREDFEVKGRFDTLEFKLTHVLHNTKFFTEILANQKSNRLEWYFRLYLCIFMFLIIYLFYFILFYSIHLLLCRIIIILISVEIMLTCYEMFLRGHSPKSRSHDS